MIVSLGKPAKRFVAIRLRRWQLAVWVVFRGHGFYRSVGRVSSPNPLIHHTQDSTGEWYYAHHPNLDREPATSFRFRIRI
jgi:hypothetical protein